MEVTDAQLLERFVLGREDQAFRALVERYGGLVLGVCQRILRQAQDAEDAFQATFLTLAQKAGELRTDEPIGNRLYGVAVRRALKLKSKRESRREDVMQDVPEPATAEERASDAVWEQLREVLDAELSRLPEKLRRPILLCHMQGFTYEAAAARLGLSHSTLKGRLDHAREALRVRLLRRGVTVSGTMLGSLLAEKASAAPSGVLVQTTVSASLEQGAAAVGVSVLPVFHPLQGMLIAMTTSRKILTAARFSPCWVSSPSQLFRNSAHGCGEN